MFRDPTSIAPSARGGKLTQPNIHLFAVYYRYCVMSIFWQGVFSLKPASQRASLDKVEHVDEV